MDTTQTAAAPYVGPKKSSMSSVLVAIFAVGLVAVGFLSWNKVRQLNSTVAQLNTQGIKDSVQRFDQFFQHISQGFQSAINGMLTGTKSFAKGMQEMWNNIVTSFVQSLVKMAVSWVQHQVAKLIVHTTTNQAIVASDAAAAAESQSISLVTALKHIAHAAASAAAHVFKSVMEYVPFPLNVVLALHPEKIWQARDAPTAQALRASLCGLFATSIAQEDAPDGATVSAALARTKATANADLPVEQGPAEPTGKHEDTVFEIDARLLVPSNGYGLTAVRRFLVAFGRRRHLGSVPFAILFGRAASLRNPGRVRLRDRPAQSRFRR